MVLSIRRKQIFTSHTSIFQIAAFPLVIKLKSETLMNNNKPTNEFKYKAVIFYVFLAGILGAIIGVEFFTDLYFVFAMLSLCYCLAKYVQMVLIMGYVNFKFSQAMTSFKKRQIQNYCSAKEITHVFVLPNYNEDIDVLRQTIRTLAQHSKSKNYCLFLAMEKHEMNAEEKAIQMIKQFSTKFRLISYTVHEIIPGESKTKSSNINYCVRNMTPKLLENFVNMDTVFVTIMDSDSIIPEAYVDQVQQHIEQNYDHRHTYIYQPPQIFTRNQKQVAFFVRIMDNLMAFMHCSNLYSMFDFTLGVSNYSLSYRLLERIDFWDTCIYSKGEDMRTPAKAVWKTNGQVKTCPIYVPINQMSLSTNEGYWADFKARILQAKRHSQDQTEVSYNFINMTQSKMSLIKRLHTFFSVCEVYMMLIVIPIPGLVLILQDLIPILPRSTLDSGSAFAIFNNLNTAILLTGFALFEIFKKKASNQLYGINTLNMLYAIQTPLLQIPMGLLFGFVPMVSASINMLTDKITFTVTPKSRSLSLGNENKSESMFTSQQIQQNNLIESSKSPACSEQLQK